MISHIKERKPIRVYIENEDFGIYEWNEKKQRYEGFIGNLTIDNIKQIFEGIIDHIKIEKN